MSIFRKFASGPYARPVICEMGGKNPAYVSAKADLDVAAEGLIRSAFGLQGEKCSACSVAYVEKPVHDALVARLKRRAENISIGNPEERSVFIGPVIDQEAVERYERVIKAARAKGRIVHGGAKLNRGDLAKGTFVEPAIVTELPREHWINREELFLPVLSVQACASLEDGISAGNCNVYGLCAGLYSENAKEIDQFLRTAEAGVLYVNRRTGATTGAWPGVQTFCGWKGSGVDGKGGLGPFTIPRYMREQSVTIMRR
jgi:1-pyrroline-5-carboxylate dehydrogenase